MADHSTAEPALPPVKLDEFLKDRDGFADGVWGATKIAIGVVVAVLVLMAVFLV